MKKLTAMLLTAVILLTVVCSAVAEIRMPFDKESCHNGYDYILCTYDERSNECVTVITDIFGFVEYAKRNDICSAYGIECDGLFEVDWHFELNRFVITDEYGEVEYITIG